MQFMLAMVGEESGWDDPGDDVEKIMEDMNRYNRTLVEAGALVDGAGLMHPSEASTLSFDADGPTVTDGPFAETKEHLAGYWVIQVDSKDDALDWAKKIPIKDGKVEVRELMGYGSPIDLETFERLTEQADKDMLEHIEQQKSE